jgi:hypothetical protein
MKWIAILIAGMFVACGLLSAVTAHYASPVALEIGHRAMDIHEESTNSPTANALEVYEVVSGQNRRVGVLWGVVLTGVFGIGGVLLMMRWPDMAKQTRLLWKEFKRRGPGQSQPRERAPSIISYPPARTPPTISPGNGRLPGDGNAGNEEDRWLDVS